MPTTPDEGPPRVHVRVSLEEGAIAIPLVPGQLFLTLHYELGDALRPVTAQDLARWGVTQSELFEHGLDRLHDTTSGEDWQRVDTVPGMAVLLTPDGAAASRLAVFERLVEEWPLGGYVVGTPSANQLFVVPLDSVTDLDGLQVLVNAVHYACTMASVALTDQIFWHDGAGWRHIGVTHDSEDVRMTPPPAFLENVGRLAAMDMVAAAGEA